MLNESIKPNLNLVTYIYNLLGDGAFLQEKKQNIFLLCKSIYSLEFATFHKYREIKTYSMADEGLSFCSYNETKTTHTKKIMDK